MRFCWQLVAVLAVTGAGVLEGGEALKSGPAVGDFLPGTFQPFNLNGKTGKNRYHCLVCEYGLNPTVMVFARERPEAKDAGLAGLLAKLDEAVDRFKDASLHAFVVFLSPEARTSVTDPQAEDSAKLVDEATAWEALLARLRPKAEKLKNVVVGVYPARGPEGYKIAKEADVALVLYRKHKVVATFAFAEGKLSETGVAEIMKAVDKLAGPTKKKAGSPTHKK
jgi:hypothetical protein